MNVAFSSGILVPQTLPLSIEYFQGFREHFQNSDVRPFFPDVPVTASISDRAGQLARDLNGALANGTFDPGQEIHIIAHSMGGLDSRLLIAQNLGDLRDRIASLTTLCTPHLGSKVADFLVGPDKPSLVDPRRVVFHLIENALSTIGIDLRGFEELTTDFAKQLAIDAAPVPGFQYFSIAGVGHANPPPTTFPLLLTHSHIDAVTHEPNDGLVHLSSAKFGEFLGEWQADHFEAAGHSIDPFRAPVFDPLPLIDGILQRLRSL